MYSTASAYKTDHICRTQYIAATPNITHSPCTSTCTTHSVLPMHLYCLPQRWPSSNKQTIVGKMTQDVGMAWKYCGVIPILFDLFLRLPSLYHYALVFIQKTVLWLNVILAIYNNVALWQTLVGWSPPSKNLCPTRNWKLWSKNLDYWGSGMLSGRPSTCLLLSEHTFRQPAWRIMLH